jgi:hypothetical protein
MITVGLPAWGNKDIMWMPLESLCLQETKYEWELIIYECNSFNNTEWDYIKSYWDRLKKAGCVRLLYMFNPVRKPLGQKWKDMAMRSNGETFIMQSTDDFTIKERIEITGDNINGAEWFDFEKFYMYSVKSKKMLLFDKNMIDVWKTGGRKALKTDILKRLPDNNQCKGVDHFIFYHVNGPIKSNSDVHKTGINTNGVNTISNREHNFYHPKPPFRCTDITLDEIDIPKRMKKKIIETEPISQLERMREQRVKVEFKKSYKQFNKGHRTYLTAAAYFNLIDYVNLIDRKLPDYIEYELS